MRFRAVSILACGLFLQSVTSAPAQEWRQTVQVITSVRYDEPLGVFADSLSGFLAQHPTTPVRRTAQDSVAIPFRELQDQLYEDGLEVGSVTHTLVRYRFALDRQSQLVETIEDVYFIYRADESRTDLAILYLDFQNPALGTFIEKRGVPSPVNMASVTSFRRLLAFPSLRNDQEMVVTEIGREAMRSEGLTPQQRVIMQLLSGHSEMSLRSYVLATKNALGATSPH